jgi:hypothetical protein
MWLRTDSSVIDWSVAGAAGEDEGGSGARTGWADLCPAAQPVIIASAHGRMALRVSTGAIVYARPAFVRQKRGIGLDFCRFVPPTRGVDRAPCI